jgi:hypothetical protein
MRDNAVVAFTWSASVSMFRDDEVWGQTTSRSSDGGLTAP